jgi:UDP-N-acetylglucosamine 2-epimerase (non-hydrolysing)/GDP/UDP-N,N'-diacetylbacillosamine 2-epimerase (hydrolysing)
MDRNELDAPLGLVLERPTLLVTYHPATADPEGSRPGLHGLLEALDMLTNARVVFTSPNADAGGSTLTAQIKAYVRSHDDRTVFHPSLGQRQYLSLLSHADAVVGNSSSGLVEAPALKTATVNIGRRQEGRPRARSVVDCDESREAISRALLRALSPEFQRVCRSATSPFGDGHAAERIVDVLRGTSFADLRKGSFVDLEGVEPESSMKHVSTALVPVSFAAAHPKGQGAEIHGHQ